MRRQIKIPGIAAVAIILPLTIAYFLSAEQVSFTVQEKDTTRESSGVHIGVGSSGRGTRTKFLVFTPDEVFEVSTSLVFMKFASAERYFALKPGGSYRAVVAGWRIPVIGQYRNIIEILPGQSQ